MSQKTAQRRSFVHFAPLAAVLLACTTQAHAQGRSPHGFDAPQCTWCADWTAWNSGWNLKFIHAWGNDAPNWWWNVVNAGHSNAPRSGNIAVFDSPGHVAYVTGVNGDPWNWTSFTVYHSNWPIGSRPHYDTFVRAGDHLVRMINGRATYHVLGYLFR